MSAAAAREVDPAAELLNRARGAEREAACEALPSEALVALAGGPRWTPDALALVGLDREVVGGHAAVLLRREGRGDDLVLSIDPGALPAVNAELARRRVDVVALARQVGQRLAAATELELPPVLALWSELAAGLTQGAHGLADQLRDNVREACRAGRPAQASKRLEAASALERVIGGPLAVAVRLGRHRVEHTQRVARDRRQLAAFVPRADALAALSRLHARSGPWALHYLGVGGVGETSFLRHLEIVDATDPDVLGRLELVADTMRARREAGDERPVALTVARIDFDYLSPAYPGADPGRLVEAIVHELTARIEHAVQDRWLRSIAEHLDVVRAYAGEAPGHEPLAPFGWEVFQRLLGFVGSLLASFEHPLLIFDTCEELMKLAPVGGKVPSVEATFRLIQELHERCGALRVIFAGRRLLAERGAGWEAPPLPVARTLTAPRAYLALHELRGFDGDEAEQALARLLPEGRRADRALIDAILATSPEDERATDVERPGAGGEEGGAEPPRYSPFRVAAYGAWVAAEPGLELEALTRGGADPYIEHRIVRRMGEPLESLLPVVALLRRFDTATLAAVLPAPDDAPALMEALAGHEWINVDHDGERGVLLTAKRSVVRPLARYLAAARAGAWDRAQRQVAAGLGPRLEAAGATGVPQEVVDAALRALGGEAAVRTWQGLEERIGAGWASALKLTRFLMGEDAAAEDATTLLGAAVRATHASALIHVEPGAELAGLWQEVETTAAEHLVGDRPADDLAHGWAPRHDGGPPRAWLLMHRARLGLAATQAWSDDGELDDQVRAITDVLDELARWKRLDALACPVIAAVEAVVERAERELDTNDIGHVIDRDLLAILEASLSSLTRTTPELTAFTMILSARLHARAVRFG